MGAVDHGGALQAFFEALAVEGVAAGDLVVEALFETALIERQIEALLFAAAGPFYGIGK